MFHALARAVRSSHGEEQHSNGEAECDTVNTEEALRAALSRYRVPNEACRQMRQRLCWPGRRSAWAQTWAFGPATRSVLSSASSASG